MTEKMVYMFTDKRTGSLKDNKLKFGGKGAGLAQMTSMGLLVPEGFTIPCKYSLLGKNWPNNLKDQVNEAIKVLEKITGRFFGDISNPLLVSVRSGAPESMPGMSRFGSQAN